MSVELNTLAPKKWLGNYGGSAPTLDSGNGISVGDYALDTSTTPNRLWVCEKDTLGSPVWVPSVRGNVRTITAGTTTLDGTYSVVLCNASAGTIAVNLPTASGINGRSYHIKKTDSSENNVVVTPNGSQKIDGSASQTITAQYVCMTIVSDGSNWYII